MSIFKLVFSGNLFRSKPGTGKPASTTAASSTCDEQHSTDQADICDNELTSFYNDLDGPNWINNDSWLSQKPLSRWYGLDVDSIGCLRKLRLLGNNLTGLYFPLQLTNHTFSASISFHITLILSSQEEFPLV